MKLIKSIYKAPYKTNIYEDNFILIELPFQGVTYGGVAALHPDDKDFFSAKVGTTIALSRARTNCMREQVEKLQAQLKERELFLKEVSGFGEKDIDPDNLFWKNLQSYRRRIHILKVQIEKEEKNLREYLDGQTKAIASIKRVRNKGQN